MQKSDLIDRGFGSWQLHNELIVKVIQENQFIFYGTCLHSTL